jgi:branched-chain amino acid transport system permease protein
VPGLRAAGSWGRSLAAVAVFVLVVAALPMMVGSGYLQNALIMTVYAALLAQAWNILGGYGGLFSFGHAVFFGVGAYGMGVLQVRLGWNAWAALPVAIGLGAAVGGLIGALCFRYGLRGSYFALVTLAFAEVFRVLANTFEFTGAGVGLMVPLQHSAAQMQFERTGFLLLILSFLALGLVAACWIGHSRFGAWLQAVRDNEDSASALGVNAFRVKMLAMVISAALMAAGGAFYMQYLRYIDPHLGFGAAVSVQALMGAIVGGVGSVWGPVLGAVALTVLGELSRNLLGDAPGLNLVIYGLVLILMVSFMPRGIMGLVARWRR